MFGLLENQKDKRLFAKVVIGLLAALQFPQVAGVLTILDQPVPFVAGFTFKQVLGILGLVVVYFLHTDHI